MTEQLSILSNGQTTHSEKAIAFFTSITARHRANLKDYYEETIALEEGIKVKINCKGQPMTYPRMPWMLVHYKNGLAALKYVMQQLKEI